MTKRYEYDIKGLIGEEARVVSKLEPQDKARYMVKVHRELWRANSLDDLNPDEKVKILSVNGLTLMVGKTAVRQP
jgi:membrane protein implicated in regulation of membrane protease activity